MAKLKIENLDLIKQIKSMRSRNYSYRDIAAETGIPRSTIQYHMAKLDAAGGLKPTQHLVLPDVHGKYADPDAFNAVMKYAETQQWDSVVQLGDLCDFDAVSHWNKNKLRLMQGKTIADEYKSVNVLLDTLTNCTEGAPITVLQGNHDYWIERYLDEYPQLQGLLEMEVGLNFDDREINFIKFWETGQQHKIGHAHFIHGTYVTKYHARRHAEAYGTNIFYGHTHDIQCYSYERQGDNATYVGHSLGTLSRYDMGYTRGKPNKWQQAFGIFYVMPDGFFWYNVVRIFDGACVVDGVYYEG
jgi:predicted phosphodiesterase